MELKLHLYSITWMFAPRPSIGPWKSDSQMLKPWIFEVRPSLLKPWNFEIRSQMLKPWIFEIRSQMLKPWNFDATALDLRSLTFDAGTSIKPKICGKSLLPLPTSIISRSWASNFPKSSILGLRLP